jgi:UDP-glucose 4-epimerase
MRRAVLVTGGAGFIGTHLVHALLQRGLKVTVFDNLSVGLRDKLPSGADFVLGDVTDLQAVQKAMTDHDAVVHLAARVAIRSSFDFAVEDTHTNVVGTAAVMRAAQRSGSVRRVVAASSMAVYADSPTPTPITELHPTAPISPYGISKLALEQLVHGMAAGAGITSAVLRLFNTYGEGQALSPYVGVVTIFTNALKRGTAPTIFGGGTQCRDFVHVDDVVQGFVRAIDSDVSGETFNIGTGCATSVNQVFEMVQAALGLCVQAAHAPAADGELRYSIADIAKAGRLLGYAPQSLLAQTLPSVVRAIAGH